MAETKISVLAGDFGKGVAEFSSGLIRFPWTTGPNSFVYVDDIEDIDIATEESVKRIGGTIGWGAAGALLLGPAGLIAGVLIGISKSKKKTEVTFVVRFEDGSKMLATADKETYTKLLARAF